VFSPQECFRFGNIFGAAQEERHALVQAVRLDGEDRARAIGGASAGLFDQVR
jgi:hypothetical protein